MELLVVVVVLGVLAAVAVPLYANHRVKAYDAAAMTDLHHLAQHEETYLATAGRYGSGTELNSPKGTVKFSPEVTLKVQSFEGTKGYCVSAGHERSPTKWYYDSTAGGMQPDGQKCPTTYATEDGMPIRHNSPKAAL
jgi:Tfp pilus assembly protein PilE